MSPPPHPSDPSDPTLNDRDGRGTGRTTRPTVRESTCVWQGETDTDSESEWILTVFKRCLNSVYKSILNSVKTPKKCTKRCK